MDFGPPGTQWNSTGIPETNRLQYLETTERLWDLNSPGGIFEMRLFEILSEDIGGTRIIGAGWLNLTSHGWVPLTKDWSHVAEVVLHPERFGLDPAALVDHEKLPELLFKVWRRPNWKDIPVRIVNNYPKDEINQMMRNYGWVRVIHYPYEETSIQSPTEADIRKAAAYLYDQAGGISKLFYDTKGNDDPIEVSGDFLMRFISGRTSRPQRHF
jgi:hypothetical protein